MTRRGWIGREVKMTHRGGGSYERELGEGARRGREERERGEGGGRGRGEGGGGEGGGRVLFFFCFLVFFVVFFCFFLLLFVGEGASCWSLVRERELGEGARRRFGRGERRG